MCPLQVDFPKLLARVDEGCRTWRKPSVVLYGANDPFCDVSGAFQFLESKRTNMKMLSVPVKVRAGRRWGGGHADGCPVPAPAWGTVRRRLHG